MFNISINSFKIFLIEGRKFRNTPAGKKQVDEIMKFHFFRTLGLAATMTKRSYTICTCVGQTALLLNGFAFIYLLVDRMCQLTIVLQSENLRKILFPWDLSLLHFFPTNLSKYFPQRYSDFNLLFLLMVVISLRSIIIKMNQY